MCAQIIFGSVKVAEWPSFGEKLIICRLCCFRFVCFLVCPSIKHPFSDYMVKRLFPIGHTPHLIFHS